MFSCKICHDSLPKEEGEYVLCSECDQGLHFDCSITKTTWKRYDNDKRENWKCNECRKIIQKKKNEYEDEDNKDGDGAGELSGQGGSQAPVTAGMMEKMFEKYTRGITDKLNEFEKSVVHNSKTMDDFLTTFNEMKKQLAQMKTNQDKIERENANLKKTVKDMKSKMMESDQKILNKNLEVSGIPDSINEPQVIMSVLCKKANVTLPNANNYEVERARTGAQDKPKAVILKFESKMVRDAVLKGCKAGRPSVADFTGNTQDNGKAVYVNEQLSPENKKLFYEANLIRKEKKYEFLWFADDKILLKKTKESRAIRIYSKEDILQ
uniref:PHD-type domain-containing protein n=1 Tax=Cacopsylla melanoneura TaxID=428564 RepID=A0A8D9E7E7_9HEMI